MAGMPLILKQIKSAPLFQHVGEAVPDKSIKTVPDWPACVAAIEGNKWVNIGTMIFNRIFAVADATRTSDWMGRNWNSLIAERSAKIAQILEPALKPIVRKHKLSKRLEWTVTGHFLQAWLLTEYEDAQAAEWNQLIVRWYLAGHVPCGYTGAVPAGKSTDALRLPDLSKGKLLVY